MVDAGLSTEEARRLLNSLYVHSSGFLQLLSDTFKDLPHRQQLLKAVWNGYATLIERANVGGSKDVSCTTVMALQYEEGVAREEGLKGDLARTSAYLQGEVTKYRERSLVAEAARVKEEARANAAEAEVPPLKKALAEAKLEAPPLRSQVKELQAELKVLERQLEEEKKQLAPLKAQIAAMSGLKAEAAAAQALVKKREAELEAARAIGDELHAKLRAEEVWRPILVAELSSEGGAAHSDAELARAIEAYHGIAETRDALVKEHEQAARMMQEQIKGLRSTLKNAEEKHKALLAAMDQTDQGAAAEKRARIEAQQKVTELEQQLLLKDTEIQAREAQIVERDFKIAELERHLEASQIETERVKVELEAALRGKASAERQVELLEIDVREAQESNKKLIAELAQAREEAKLVRNELDATKLAAFRAEEELKAQLSDVIIERDGARSAKTEAEEQTKVWKERAEKLEPEVLVLRGKFKDIETAHQQQLTELSKQAQLAQRSDAEALQRARKLHLEERKVLSVAMKDVSTFSGMLEEMRADMMRLAADNVALTAEVEAYKEALNLGYELKALLDQTYVATDRLEDLARDVVPPLQLLPERQRVIDATERELEITQEALASIPKFIEDEIDARADILIASHLELPGVKEKVVEGHYKHAEALSLVERVRDEAAEERARYKTDLAAQAKMIAEMQEHSSFTQGVQKVHIDERNKQLAEMQEELEQWRDGKLRYIDPESQKGAKFDINFDDPNSGKAPGEISTAGGGLDQSGARMLQKAGAVGGPVAAPQMFAATGSGTAVQSTS